MNISQNNICIIPARGGSKRIPRKNIRVFLGHPIIEYSIKAALASKLFSVVMVSTDDKEIADVARAAGAEVPFFRSTENSDDFATTLDVLHEVITKYERNSHKFDNICCIYPTAPFVNADKLKDSYQLLIDKNFDSILSVVKYSFPVQRSFSKDDSGLVQYKFPENKNKRSQDLESTYHDAGQFYWMKVNIINNDSIATDNTGGIECSELEVQDIDSELDWKLAELKYALLQDIR